MQEFLDDNGLLNSRPLPPGQSDENVFLFTLTYCRLAQRLNPLHAQATVFKGALRAYLKKIKNSNGFYDNMLNHGGGDRRYTSHDQYRAYSQFAHDEGLPDGHIIANQINDHWWTYDNTKGRTSFERMVHPRDAIYLSYVSGRWWAWPLMPLYYLMGLFTFYRHHKVRPKWHEILIDKIKGLRLPKKGEGFWQWVVWLEGHLAWPKRRKIVKTDNEILLWLEAEHDDHLLAPLFHAYANWRIKRRFGSWATVFETYYRPPDHPIRKLVEQMPPSALDMRRRAI